MNVENLKMDKRAWLSALVGACTFWMVAGVALAQEVAITEEEFKKLDSYEGTSLSKADRVFAKKEYRQAAAEYDAFVLNFPKSVAQAYAVFRKARCLQLDNKRFEAIKAYNEVLDYFPDSVQYAAAALYHIGESQEQNGDPKEAMKAWAEMAKDKDYRKHYLAAGAINRLADNLVKQNKFQEATDYYKQVASDFRQSNKPCAVEALQKVVGYYLRGQPDAAKMREFYDKIGGFDWDSHKTDDNNFWDKVREVIRQQQFQPTEKEAREKFFSYWAQAMEGKMADHDDFQIDQAWFRRYADNDAAKFNAKMDAEFNKRQKPDDYGRIVKWISSFRDQKPKAQEYYGKLDFAKMKPEQVVQLVRVLFDKLNDAQKYDFARYLWHKDGSLVELTCQNYTDKELGKIELLRYFHWARNYDKGIPLADDVAGIPKFTKDAYWMKAEMLHWQNKFQEALGAYQSADNPPHNQFRISECFMGLGKKEQAIAALREIENFFADQAPEAALRVANIYRDTKDNKLYVAELRGILKKYPKSGQSSTAHQELERLGLKSGGAVDAE